MSFLDSLNSPLGPLKAWQWGIIGGAGVAILLVLRGRGQGGGAQQGSYVVLPVGTGKVTTPPAGFGSFGGLDMLTNLLCRLPNAPDEFSLSMPDGSALHFSNGVGTFGNTSAVIGQGQSATGINFNPCKPDLPATPAPSGVPSNPYVGSWFAYIPDSWNGQQGNEWQDRMLKRVFPGYGSGTVAAVTASQHGGVNPYTGKVEDKPWYQWVPFAGLTAPEFKTGTPSSGYG